MGISLGVLCFVTSWGMLALGEARASESGSESSLLGRLAGCLGLRMGSGETKRRNGGRARDVEGEEGEGLLSSSSSPPGEVSRQC